MRAIKVLYRDPDGNLHSAIPTPYALAYAEGKKTVPEIGRVMVFLGADDARDFCYTAAGWYRTAVGFLGLGDSRGNLEVWAVECRNLYKMCYIIAPCDLADCGECGISQLMRFWQIVAEGGNPRHDVLRAAMARTPIWATDWIIPQEKLGVYNILRKMWTGGTEWSKCYYYGRSCDYRQGVWQCQTCKEWYCYYHDHDTALGYCVECVACERERLEREELNERRERPG